MLKYTLKLDVRESQKRKKGYPVTLFLFAKGQQKKVLLKLYYEIDQWDFELNLPKNDTPGKIKIKEKLLLLDQIELEFLSGNYSTFEQVKKRISGDINTVKVNSNDFIGFGRVLANEKLQLQKNKTASVYNNALNQLIKYRAKILFSDLTYTFLNSFKRYQLAAGNSKNTAHNYLRTLRAIYNEGVRRGLTEDSKPFSGVFVGITVKSNRTKKRNLAKESIIKFEQVTGLPAGQQLAVDLFLLLFYLGGQDLKDLYYLKSNKLTADRVYFERGKLDDAGYQFDLKLFPKALGILNKYKTSGKYLFPWRKDENGYETFKRRFQTNLVLVQKKLEIEVLPLGGNVSIKVARHTFATIGKQLFIESDLLRELMGHERNDVDTIYKDKYPEQVRDEAHWQIIS